MFYVGRLCHRNKKKCDFVLIINNFDNIFIVLLCLKSCVKFTMNLFKTPWFTCQNHDHYSHILFTNIIFNPYDQYFYRSLILKMYLFLCVFVFICVFSLAHYFSVEKTLDFYSFHSNECVALFSQYFFPVLYTQIEFNSTKILFHSLFVCWFHSLLCWNANFSNCISHIIWFLRINK